MSKKYDVFISYRRQGGEQTAKIISDRLTDMGHKVFYDVEALRSGAFNTKLFSVIEECKDVIVVLSPESLDRCSNENDWVRLEVAHALKTGKNVIPVFLRGFTFPEILVEDIEALKYQNGLEANSEFFDAFIEKLQSFLQSKPTILQRINQSVVFKRTAPLALTILIILGIAVGITALIKNSSAVFPKSQEQKNVMNEALSYLEQNLTVIDGAFRDVSDAYGSCENYLMNPDQAQYKTSSATIYDACSSISRLEVSSDALSDSLSAKMDSTPVNKGDLVAVNEFNRILCDSFQSSLLFIKQITGQDSPVDIASKRKILGIYKEMLNYDKMNIVYGINDLLLPVNQGFLSQFKQKFLPTLVNIPFGSQPWINNKEELERLMDSVYYQQLQLSNDLASIIGSENYNMMLQEVELEQYALKLGMSPAEIDEYLADVVVTAGTITNLKQQLEQSIVERKNLDIQAREKFAPLETDTPEMLWGKMLRFMTLELYEDAIKCAQMYQIKTQSDYPDASIYVPAVIRFINQISATGVNYGVVVCAFEPGIPKHAVYEMGDIIIAVNDQICFRYEDYLKLKPAEEEYKVTVLRPGADGGLVFTDLSIPSGQPKIMLLDLKESE